MPLQRVTDAQKRFLSSPLSQVANRLEQEYLGGIYTDRRFHAEYIIPISYQIVKD
jgi:hypothetical protein